MKEMLLAVMTAMLMCGCTNSEPKSSEANNMQTVNIRWQRLVDEKGKTCERCGSTEKEVRKAVSTLKKSLKAVGTAVALEEETLSLEAFAKDCSQSNRIWINERPLEEWLGAQTGKSLCGGCCSMLGEKVECRTMALGGKTYEAIPAELIVKAGLLAASQVAPTPSEESSRAPWEPVPILKAGSGCCPTGSTGCASKSACCPKPAQKQAKGKQ
jgi:hypothetical protein